jgi:hypothetical protein
MTAFRYFVFAMLSSGSGRLKLAPFHLLATEGQVHVQRDHVWHMEKLAEVCMAGDGLCWPQIQELNFRARR